MKKFELSIEDEKKWLEKIKQDKKNFIFHLHDYIITHFSNNQVISMSNNLIMELLFEKEKVKDKNNEYEVYKYKFIDEDYMENAIITICEYIDFKHFTYHNLVLNQLAVNIMSDNDIVIDLNHLYDKNFENLEIIECIIAGSFDGANLKSSTIEDNETMDGKKIKINPQKIKDKNFYNAKIDGVEFTDSFDNCNIAGLSVKNSDGVIINPQKVRYRNLSNCDISNAFFSGTLDYCNIDNIQLSNVSKVYVNAENLCYHHFSNDIDFNYVNIIIKNEIGYYKFKSYFKHLSYDALIGSTIICNLDIKNRLMGLDGWDYSYGEVDFNIIDLDIDNVLENTFKNEFEKSKKEEKKKRLFNKLKGK